MQTRREILRQSLITPLVLGTGRGVEIVSGSDCLSQESAAGFHLLLKSVRATGMTIVCGSRYRLHPKHINRGTWVIYELPPGEAEFDASDGLYVRYCWPHPALVRTFLRFVPIRCAGDEVIATYGGRPVAMKRRMGRGGVIVLGSMLGPALYAGDAEAHRLGIEMLGKIGELRS